MGSDPFEVLRRLAGDPVPTDAERQRARARLREVIGAERTRSRRRWPVPVAVAAALVVAVAAALVVVSRPNPVEAALSEIAHAARLAAPQEVPEGSFLYTRSEEISAHFRPGDELGLADEWVLLTPIVRQVWRHGDFEQQAITTNTPIFFDPQVEAAYYAHGLDKIDHIGETVTRQLTGVTNELGDIDWPTDPRQLRGALEAYVRQGAMNQPIDIEVFRVAADLLTETDPGPGVRAALMEVFAQLPVTLVDQASDGAVTLAVAYNQPPQLQYTITLDSLGHLIAETQTFLEAGFGVPAGTQVLDITYTVPTIVDNLYVTTP
ncbi:MAG TPA: hypothetical protein ENH00_14560 [Actinobacteria bacterium]|nr:hypothetical protein BMS3Bbin01_01688 [bacterium BMS3Bbin01]HDH27389.1 hypothetical protein [Actinomycetota bacterium]